LNIKNSNQDYSDLKKAFALMESPSLVARMSNFVGSPIEGWIKKLPKKVTEALHGIVEAALQKSADVALWSMENAPHTEASPKLHKFLAVLSGAVGGTFGFSALAVEVPVSTTIIMRSIADIARSEGFDLNEIETKTACLEVFAFGGTSEPDDGSETAYYAVRAFLSEVTGVLAKELPAMANQTVRNLTSQQAGMWLAEFIAKIAARFGVVITEKAAAQIVPALGAVGGATMNIMFTDYYQDMARGHFIVKRLERKYGPENVQGAYNELMASSEKKAA
jgi:hypothetical protein